MSYDGECSVSLDFLTGPKVRPKVRTHVWDSARKESDSGSFNSEAVKGFKFPHGEVVFLVQLLRRHSRQKHSNENVFPI